MGCGDSKSAHNYPKETAAQLDDLEEKRKAGNITQHEFDETKQRILKEFCVEAQGKW